MRLGGFVIHSNSAATLGRCLADLTSVCDDVVAVDSGSTDGSSDIARAAGARPLAHPWRGYGAARSAAVAALHDCDYVMFLDSDEWGGPGWHAGFDAWRNSDPSAPYFVVRRRHLHMTSTDPPTRYVFKVHDTLRLARCDAAHWTSRMIVHEAPYPYEERRRFRNSPSSGVVVDHELPRRIPDLVRKQEEYALLWAVLAYVDQHRAHEARLSRWANRSVIKHWTQTARHCPPWSVLTRVGRDRARLAWAWCRYDVRKYQLLREVEHGAYAHVVQAFREERLADVYALAAAATLPRRVP